MRRTPHSGRATTCRPRARKYGKGPPFATVRGVTRWYFFDLGRDAILEEPGEIVASIRSTLDTPRSCKTEQQTLVELKGKVEKHIYQEYVSQTRGRAGRRQTGAQVRDGTERGLNRWGLITAGRWRRSRGSTS